MAFENLARLEDQLEELQRRATTTDGAALRERIMTFSQKVYTEMEAALADVEDPLTTIVNIRTEDLGSQKLHDAIGKLDATHSRDKFKNILEICDRLDELAHTYRGDIDQVLNGDSGSYSELFWLLEKNEGIFRRTLEHAVGDIARELREVRGNAEALETAQGHAEDTRRELREHLGRVRRARIGLEGRAAGMDRLLDVRKRADEVLRKSPWFSGSFYLGATLVLFTTLTFLSGKLDVMRFVLVLAGTYVGVTVIGAFQLRNDGKLSEQNFFELLQLAFTRVLVPVLKRTPTV